MSNTDSEKSYQSICEVRKTLDLGCRNCVLRGYRECLESAGEGPPVGQIYNPVIKGSPYGRSLDGYVCHVNIRFPELVGNLKEGFVR